jgi:hypothetical protein
MRAPEPEVEHADRYKKSGPSGTEPANGDHMTPAFASDLAHENAKRRYARSTAKTAVSPPEK